MSVMEKTRTDRPMHPAIHDMMERCGVTTQCREFLLQQQTLYIDGKFTAVQQAIGTKPDRPIGAAFLQDFVDEAKASGFVADLLEKHGVAGDLTVAASA